MGQMMFRRPFEDVLWFVPFFKWCSFELADFLKSTDINKRAGIRACQYRVVSGKILRRFHANIRPASKPRLRVCS